MSITLHLDPEVEKYLTALARARGLSLSDYLQEIASKAVARSSSGEDISGEERAKAFLDWADSFPETAPLSDEAISRASMYPDRW